MGANGAGGIGMFKFVEIIVVYWQFGVEYQWDTLSTVGLVFTGGFSDLCGMFGLARNI